jgi:ribosomal protein S26
MEGKMGRGARERGHYIVPSARVCDHCQQDTQKDTSIMLMRVRASPFQADAVSAFKKESYSRLAAAGIRP